MREQDSGNIVFYHSVRVLLLTPSVFYSFLSHYQVAPQLHGKCYIHNKSQTIRTLSHNQLLCSVMPAALHYIASCSQYLVSGHSILLVFTARKLSDFWLLILPESQGPGSRWVRGASRTNLRLRGPETRAGDTGAGARHFVSGQQGTEKCIHQNFWC